MSPANESVIDQEVLQYEFYADPYPTFHRLRSEDPVHWNEQWGAWLLTRYTDVVSVLRDWSRFSNVGRISRFLDALPSDVRKKIRPFEEHFTTGLINSDPPEHTRFRRLVSKAFTPAVVEGLRPHIQSIVDELIDKVLTRERMDVIGDFAYLLPTTVIAQLIGVPLGDRNRFNTWADGITSFQGTGRALSRGAINAQDSLLELRDYFRRLIADRRRQPRDDLISRLANAEDQGDLLNEAELLSISVTLLLAGYETTMSLIGNSVLALLRHPDQLRKLRSDPTLMTSAVEELMRFDSPVGRQNRVARQDLELGGRQIRKGQLVAALLGAANRDPQQFPDPDRLDITRSENRHVAFGYGIHFCVGAPLARLEAQIAIGTLFRRIAGIELADDPPVWREDINIHGLKSLPVVF